MPTPADLLALSRACRTAAGAYAVEIGRHATSAVPSIHAADLCTIAVQLQQASDQLARAAQDPRLIKIGAHLAAGGDVLLLPLPAALPVVVSQDADAAASEQPRPKVWVRLARALRRTKAA